MYLNTSTSTFNLPSTRLKTDKYKYEVLRTFDGGQAGTLNMLHLCFITVKVKAI